MGNIGNMGAFGSRDDAPGGSLGGVQGQRGDGNGRGVVDLAHQGREIAQIQIAPRGQRLSIPPPSSRATQHKELLGATRASFISFVCRRNC